MQEPRLTWAIQNGIAKHISEVQKGLACGCICPQCQSQLIAKQGEHNAYHFAHYGQDACNNTGESTLHKAAKQIIKSAGFIVLPSHPYMVGKPQKYVFDSVELERAYGGFIPDIIARIGDKIMIIEICVTHKVDAEKRAKIAASGASAAIEIYLDRWQDLAPDSLYKSVIEGLFAKKWLYSAAAESAKQQGQKAYPEGERTQDNRQLERWWQEKIKVANDKCWILDIAEKEYAIFISNRGEFLYRLGKEEFDGFACLETAFKHLFKNHLRLRSGSPK